MVYWTIREGAPVERLGSGAVEGMPWDGRPGSMSFQPPDTTPSTFPSRMPALPEPPVHGEASTEIYDH